MIAKIFTNSAMTVKIIVNLGSLKTIFITSIGKTHTYIIFIDEVSETPELNAVPEYYRLDANRFKTWFKITRFEKADKDIMSKCFVVSSHSLLTQVSMYSMSPYYFIEIDDSLISK